MKQKIIGGVLAVLLIAAAVFGYRKLQERKNYISPEARAKVVFEGLGQITSEDCKEIAGQVNAAAGDKHPSLVIELNNVFNNDVELPPMGASHEEVDAAIAEQRRRLKEFHAKTNAEVIRELGLSLLDATYTSSEYAPYVNVQFNGEISEKDMKRIYKMAANKSVGKIYVKAESIKKN